MQFSEIIKNIFECETTQLQCAVQKIGNDWSFTIYGKKTFFGYVKKIATGAKATKEAAIQAATEIMMQPVLAI